MGTTERYWQEFIDTKRDAIYIDYYYRDTENIDRIIKIIIAVTSSTSIGAWVIWRDMNWLWGSIIAMSQVISAIKEYLPYKHRLAALSGLSKQINGLAISAESDWFKIQKGALTEEEIDDLQIGIKKTKLSIVQKHFPIGSLPENKKILTLADKATRAYVGAFYGVTDE